MLALPPSVGDNLLGDVRLPSGRPGLRENRPAPRACHPVGKGPQGPSETPPAGPISCRNSLGICAPRAPSLLSRPHLLSSLPLRLVCPSPISSLVTDLSGLASAPAPGTCSHEQPHWAPGPAGSLPTATTLGVQIPIDSRILKARMGASDQDRSGGGERHFCLHEPGFLLLRPQLPSQMQEIQQKARA